LPPKASLFMSTFKLNILIFAIADPQPTWINL